MLPSPRFNSRMLSECNIEHTTPTKQTLTIYMQTWKILGTRVLVYFGEDCRSRTVVHYGKQGGGFFFNHGS